MPVGVRLRAKSVGQVSDGPVVIAVAEGDFEPKLEGIVLRGDQKSGVAVARKACQRLIPRIGFTFGRGDLFRFQYQIVEDRCSLFEVGRTHWFPPGEVPASLLCSGRFVEFVEIGEYTSMVSEFQDDLPVVLTEVLGQRMIGVVFEAGPEFAIFDGAVKSSAGLVVERIDI